MGIDLNIYTFVGIDLNIYTFVGIDLNIHTFVGIDSMFTHWALILMLIYFLDILKYIL